MDSRVSRGGIVLKPLYFIPDEVDAFWMLRADDRPKIEAIKLLNVMAALREMETSGIISAMRIGLGAAFLQVRI